MSFAPLNILVSSAANKVPLIRAVQRAARKMHPENKVIAGDADESVLTRYVADDFWHMPCTIDEEVEVLLLGCKQRDISIIIPTRDGELLFWAEHRGRFLDAGINVVVSDVSSVRVCLDKLAFSQFGLLNGLPFIQADVTPREVGAGPYVVKERYGAGARKLALNLDCAGALLHGYSMEKPIYQLFMSGREISIDAWLDRSCEVKGLVLRTRDYVVNGESQVTSTFHDVAIEKEATKIMNALKLCGPVVMQAFVDTTRRIQIIECNTRIGGASTASIAVGLDIFYWSLLEICGADLHKYPFDRSSDEVRQIRVADDIYEYGFNF